MIWSQKTLPTLHSLRGGCCVEKSLCLAKLKDPAVLPAQEQSLDETLNFLRKSWLSVLQRQTDTGRQSYGGERVAFSVPGKEGTQ